MGAYNRMYFLFTENGLMIFWGSGGGGTHRQLFVVIIIEVNVPLVYFITFFYKHIFPFFPNHLRPGNICSESKVKEGLQILLKRLAATFPFSQLITKSYQEPIVIKFLLDIKGKSYFLRVNCGMLASYSTHSDWGRHWPQFFLFVSFFCTNNKYSPRSK